MPVKPVKIFGSVVSPLGPRVSHRPQSSFDGGLLDEF
jgi:hypothetical protein